MFIKHLPFFITPQFALYKTYSSQANPKFLCFVIGAIYHLYNFDIAVYFYIVFTL